MTRRNSSIGFFGIFGRSEDLRGLDRAFRAVGLHPALVPEGAKLTIVNLMKDRWRDTEPPRSEYSETAALFAYCLLGEAAFAAENGEAAALAAARRMRAALDAGSGADAELVLLSVHAKLINPEMLENYGIEVTDLE